MKLQLSPEDAAFREEMRTFFTTQVPQKTRDIVAARRELSKALIVETQQILNAAGLAVPNWPVEWGGRDWTPLQRHIWHEEMQLASVPIPLAFNASMVGPVIAAFGSQEIKERFLAKTANLDIWWSQGFSEPDAGCRSSTNRLPAASLRRCSPWAWRPPASPSTLHWSSPPASSCCWPVSVSSALCRMHSPGFTSRLGPVCSKS